MTWIADELGRAAKIKAARAAKYATETLAEAQAALIKAQARYNTRSGGIHVYDIASARDRVAAALRREPVAPRLMCPESRDEWWASGGI